MLGKVEAMPLDRDMGTVASDPSVRARGVASTTALHVPRIPHTSSSFPRGGSASVRRPTLHARLSHMVMAKNTLATFATGVVAGSLLTILHRKLQETNESWMDHCHSSSGADDDDTWLALCHKERLARVRLPSQSSFRVTAVVVYTNASGAVAHVVGHNDEAVVLVNSICAERAAFLQLAATPRSKCHRVIGVYITSDAPEPITPGMLCREFMNSSPLTRPDTRVLMEGGGVRLELTLRELYPHPSPYLYLNADEQEAAGKRFQAAFDPERCFQTASTAQAWRGAVRAASGDGSRLHPISYGACVVFSDGSEATSCQWKALEYGCSLDATCQLVPTIVARRGRGVEPVVMCLADQYGVCHAPFSNGRALLVEHGCGELRILLADAEGNVCQLTAKELMPGMPAGIKDFLRDAKGVVG